ncbi:MAG: TrbG/VirB9 family P-type conjugative transfer protein [Rhodopila sp.]
MRTPVIVAGCLLAATPAMAEVTPKAGPRDDQHIQTAVCASGQVVDLHLMVGRTVAIEMPPAMTNNQAYGSDSAFVLSDIPAGTNMIFLKPKKAQAPKPFFVLSMMPDGKNQICTLQIDITDAPGATPLPYKLKIIDPAAEAVVRAASWKVAQRRRTEEADRQALRDAVAHPVDTNFRYVLEGKIVADWNLLPSRHVADDGHSTHFYMSAARSVEIYTVAPDGTEAVPDCSPDAETHVTTCHQIAAQWRLRDGDAELCIFNRGPDTVGTPVPDGTASPDYQRELRAAR